MSVQGPQQEQEGDIDSPLSLIHRPPSAPPPYSYPPSTSTPNGTGAQFEPHNQLPPSPFSAVPHGGSKSPCRPLPPLPEPRIDTNRLGAETLPLASGSRSSICVVSTMSASSNKIPSSSYTPSASSPSLPSSLQPPLTLDTSPSSLSLPGPVSTRSSTKHHPFMPLFTLLRSSKSRSPTNQNAARKVPSAMPDTRPQPEDPEQARRAAELERGIQVAAEERARVAATQADAKEAIRSHIRSLLSRHLPSDEYKPILKKCAQICENGDLDFAVVLQEPLIDEKPPIYWAILNGPSSQGGDADFHALVVAIVDACLPLHDATITSIRLACMLTSNNVLLQHLFRHFAALSPLNPGEVILLSSVGGGDVVNVEEMQDGTGAFVARIQVRRFRLRMRVSKLIKVEFVTSDRIWTITFSVLRGNDSFSRSESWWLLSVGLANHSIPAWVNADLVISGSPPTTNTDEADILETPVESPFTFPIRHDLCELKPGSENAIRIRLDDGPMGPHLLNESQALVDADGTLHAEFTVRLTRPIHSVLLAPSIDLSDTASQVSSAMDAATTSTTMSSESPRSPISLNFRKKEREPPISKPVYATLRRGGR